ncbi:MAG: hypothetical protein ABR976_12365 [Terracidiphilus sp.]
MQTLGLSGETKRSDGWLKSIFWPTVDNAWDVDYLGQQGFWICFLIAIFQLGFSLFTGNVIIIGAGLAGALLYYLGGMGVREKSWPAAAIIFACYFVETLISVLAGAFWSPGGVVKIIFLGLLLSNLRATFIASEWKPAAEGEDRPERFSETFRDKLVDAWPPRLWRILQIPFYVLGAIWFLLSLIILLGAILVRMGIVPANLRH